MVTSDAMKALWIRGTRMDDEIEELGRSKEGLRQLKLLEALKSAVDEGKSGNTSGEGVVARGYDGYRYLSQDCEALGAKGWAYFDDADSIGITDQGVEAANRLKDLRSSLWHRGIRAQDVLLDWLYSLDPRPVKADSLSDVLGRPEAHYLGVDLTEQEIWRAWLALEQKGLVEGRRTTDQKVIGPVISVLGVEAIKAKQTEPRG